MDDSIKSIFKKYKKILPFFISIIIIFIGLSIEIYVDNSNQRMYFFNNLSFYLVRIGFVSLIISILNGILNFFPRIIKVAFQYLVLFYVVVFVIWMNVTPGHYQYACCNTYVYVTQEEMDYKGEANPYRLSCAYFYCERSRSVAVFYEVLEKIDFYK